MQQHVPRRATRPRPSPQPSPLPWRPLIALLARRRRPGRRRHTGRFPLVRLGLPHLRRDGHRDQGRADRPPGHRPGPLDRQELPGPRHLGRQGVRQRGDRRERARGHVRLDAPRAGAPVARAGPRAAALADRRLRQGQPDHEHRQHPRDLDRVHGQPRRRRIRPDRLAVPLVAEEPPAERRDDRHRHRCQPELRLPLGVLWRFVVEQVVADLSRLGRVLDARGSGHPRLHGQPAHRRAAADPDGHHVPHAPASRSCGRTATRRRTSRAT